MAEATRIFTKRDGVLTLGEQGGGAWNATTGAALGDTYEIAFEAGTFALTVPGPATQVFLDRGRLTSPPQVRYGDDQVATFTFTAYMRDMGLDGAANTLADVLHFSVGSTDGTSNVNSNWESTLASSSGAADAEVVTLGCKWQLTNSGGATAGDGLLAFNYCALTWSTGDGDPNEFTVNGTIYDAYGSWVRA